MYRRLTPQEIAVSINETIGITENVVVVTRRIEKNNTNNSEGHEQQSMTSFIQRIKPQNPVTHNIIPIKQELDEAALERMKLNQIYYVEKDSGLVGTISAVSA
jgi:hypothetical protein